MLKYILAVLAILLIWVGWIGLLVAELLLGIWVPITLSVVVILIVVAMVVVRKLRARRAAAQLEKALAEQAAQHAQSARPDLQAEILEMQGEFDKAVSALKSSKLGSGKDALYKLPWQIIIGPPGAGKTTALRNSGLQFPYLSAKTGGAVRGLGGTRNCDWWLTNESVILDTAGRWTTEDEDREEWLGFLDLVKKFRPRKPLNGIIAAVSVSDIGGASEDEVTALAQKVRERVDEAMNRLQMSLPVYVLFTKCDLIPGFVETFGDLAKNQRGQLWGFTVPIKGSTAVGPHFDSRFDQLIDQVEGRMLRRMNDERRIETREMLYTFPRQLDALKSNLSAFTAQLFEENVFRETPIFRGVYFTSGTQEGNPIDRVMGRMAEAFGIQSGLPVSQAPTTPKSYFLHNVFREVIFKDADLAVRSEAELKRRKRIQLLVAAAVLFVALLFLTLPAYSWFQNSSMLGETENVLDVPAAVASTVPGVSKRPLASPDLIKLHNRVATLDDGAPLTERAGMYRGDTVEDPLKDYYRRVLKTRVVNPLLEQIQNDLNSFGREYEALRHEQPSREDFDLTTRRLRSYLLLTTPTEVNQPAWDDDLIEDLSTDLTNRWAKTLGVEPTSANGKKMAEQMQWFVARMAEDPANVAFPREKLIVRRARGGLTRVSTVDLAVDGFITQFEGRGMDLSLQRIVGRRLSGMNAKRVVRAAFTREVFFGSIRESLQSSLNDLAGEPWVLGDITGRNDNEAEQQRRIVAVREQYFQRYIDEWTQFLRSITVSRPQDNRVALEAAQFLTSGEPTPLQALFQQTKLNTTLRTPEELAESESKAGKAAKRGLMAEVRRTLSTSKVGRVGMAAIGDGSNLSIGGQKQDVLDEDDVIRAFDGFTRFGVPPTAAEGQQPASTGLDVYEEQILFVRNALQTHFDDPSEPEVMLEKIQTARTKARGLISEQEVGWRPVFESILWPPIDGTSFSVTKAMAKGTGRTWCAEVVNPFEQTIRGFYPFNRVGHDMSFDDFAAFYNPAGILWTYYDDVLDNHVEREGDRFEFGRSLGRTQGQVFQPILLRFLKRSRSITEAFFPPGAEGPQVDFDVRIRPCPRVAIQELNIGGQEMEYHNGPEEWVRYSWPGEDTGAGASVEIRGAGGIHERIEQEGEWGLFHLLERGTVVSGAGARVFTVVWHLRTHDVDITIDFRPVRADTPFFGVAGGRGRDLMNPVRAADVEAPHEIVTGDTTCPRALRGT